MCQQLLRGRMLPPLPSAAVSVLPGHQAGGESPHSPHSLCTCVRCPASLQAFHSLYILVSGVHEPLYMCYRKKSHSSREFPCCFFLSFVWFL